MRSQTSGAPAKDCGCGAGECNCAGGCCGTSAASVHAADTADAADTVDTVDASVAAAVGEGFGEILYSRQEREPAGGGGAGQPGLR